MEGVVLVLADILQMVAASLLDAEACRESDETREDALRILRGGKHAFVALRDEGHSFAFEPFVGVAVAELLEQALHEFVAARVGLLGIADEGEGIGEVASSAAGDGHLG